MTDAQNGSAPPPPAAHIDNSNQSRPMSARGRPSSARPMSASARRGLQQVLHAANSNLTNEDAKRT
eukprot:CAMPEP_0197848390 /NCGR_PEP_ID=MMETSP1438-20131217/8587_1 /TAXON_ID=1461541 /ORGANISM="Pterosperma sp., Strain CCMP1384" /LENGTH=65 /DNA_ID=CAMNT_0043460609 /DNA_START=58 /DNA_END=255 /DNA_ORIENTATION=-